MKYSFAIVACGLMLSAWCADVPVKSFMNDGIWPRARKGFVPSCTMIKENGKTVSVRITQPAEAYNARVTRLALRNFYPIDGGKNLQKKYEGIAFEVKGDGSAEWGCISLGDGRAAGQYYFPVAGKNWKEYRVCFADMAPASDHTLGLPRAVRVGEIAELSFGDRWQITWCNQKRKQFSYEVRNLRLIEKIAPVLDAKEIRVRPLADVIKMMKSGKAVQVTCFGDSITAGTGLKGKDKRYAVLLGEMLVKKFNNKNIKTACTAVGGAHSYDSIAWLERDLSAGIPDVATMLIGYNNYSARQSPEMYRAQLEMWMRRLSILTKGKTAFILIPAIPAVPRYFAQDEMARITYEVAKKYGCTVAPVNETFKKMDWQLYNTKYQADGVHPNQLGHQVMANELLKCFSK